MIQVLIRCILTVVIGILLIVYRDAVLPFIVQCLGVAFVIPGLFALGRYLFSKMEMTGALSWMSLVTSFGSVVFGLWLLFSPGFFIAILMNVLGVLLVLFGVYQSVQLFASRKYVSRVPVALYIMPVLLLLLGLFVLANPFGVAPLPFMLLGIGAVVGGLSDFISSVFVMRSKRHNSMNIIE